MIDLGLVVARLLHYAAVTTLAGVSFFPLYAYADAEPIVLHRWRQGVLLAAAITALLSGILWFVFSVASMSGTLADVGEREVLWTVVHDTRFGSVWTGRLVLAIITVGLAACLIFGIIVLASGDWVPGGIIVAASTVGLAREIPTILQSSIYSNLQSPISNLQSTICNLKSHQESGAL